MNRHRRRILSAATSLAAVASLALAGSVHASDHSQQPTNDHQVLGTVEAASLPSADPSQGGVKIGSSESCSPIALSEQAAHSGATKACVSTKPLTRPSSALARTSGQLAANEACDITKPGYWTWTRTGGMCLNGMETTYTLRDDKGKVLGTGVMNVKSSMALDAASTSWKELITVQVTAVTGQVKNLNIAFDVGCTSSCSATNSRPWTGGKSLGKGAQASGSVAYTDKVASGGVDNVQTKYHMYVTTTGSIPTQPNVNWQSCPRQRSVATPCSPRPAVSFLSAAPPCSTPSPTRHTEQLPLLMASPSRTCATGPP